MESYGIHIGSKLVISRIECCVVVVLYLEAIVVGGEEDEGSDEADEANEMFSFDFVDPHERFVSGMIPLLKDFLPGSAQVSCSCSV